jgi:hypothetical protein
MTDQFDPTLGGSDDTETPSNIPMPEATPEEDLNFLSDNNIDPATLVKIMVPSGSPKYVPVLEPTPLNELIVRANLTYSGKVDCYVDGAAIDMTALVSGGQTVTLIGNVKGG